MHNLIRQRHPLLNIPRFADLLFMRVPFALQGHYGVQSTKKALFYRAFLHGDEGGRTPDLLNAIQALSQLSYVPRSHWFSQYTRAAGVL